MVFRFLIAASALALAAPLSAYPFQGDEPVGVPSNVEQGIDFVYVDPKLKALADQPRQSDNWMLRSVGYDWGPGWGSGQDAGQGRDSPNPIFVELRRGLDEYRMRWGSLPQIQIPQGVTLKSRSEGERVDMLRERLGLPLGWGFDAELGDVLSDYQRVHGLEVTGIADSATIESLNRGADHYEQLIVLNLERARRLPLAGKFERYVLVDSGAAEVYLYDRDRVADRMRAIVGSKENRTPMMAVIMQNAKVNPYWNVPPEMIRTFTAPKVLKQGTSYLKNYHYEVLSDWSPDAVRLDPAEVDWEAVAAGGSDIRVRQKPGPWNSMGEIKFETPNDYGIYLHDTPNKALFAEANRWISNGCVRLEDADRFASWVFGAVPEGSSAEEVVPLRRPVPVYMTYLTAVPGPDGGVQFRGDPYGFDSQAMQRLPSSTREIAAVGY
ncbi:MAG: L,D-transpeptidase family protein [Sphingomicrobium sp.]